MKKYIILLLISFQGILAQVQFEAKVSKQTLGLNEKLRIDFIMNEDGDNFVAPSFEGFRVIAGPYQSVKVEYVNGHGAFNKTYSYFLLPTQRGSVMIKQASVEIGGKIFKTNPIKISVTAAVEQPRDPNDTQMRADDALHLVAEVSKTNPYINEPITVVYKLYFDYNVAIREYRELEKPKYNDFWSQNIEIKRPHAEEGKFNGERCLVAVLKKTVLYPQKAGKLEIEPLSLDLDLELPSNRRTIFGQMVMVQDNKRVSAGATTIHVKPLPDAGKPQSFTGAVGKFSFTASPSKTNLKNGESLDLKVTVTGNGNLKLFNLPKPVVPSALEMYDPVHKENISTPISGMTGSVTDNYTIIPQYKGKYPIQPMEFSYFDPVSGRYKTINSPEIMINVLDGPMAAGAVAANENEPEKMKIAGTEQFRFIRLKSVLTDMHQKDFFGSGTFYTLVLLPFLCIPLLILFRKKKEAIDNDVAGNKIRASNRLAKRYLSEASGHMNNKELFYVALEKALHNFLKAKLHIETSEMSKDKIREVLLSRNAGIETVDAFLGLSENCEFARYAPSSAVAIQQDYEKAVSIVSALEKQI